MNNNEHRYDYMLNMSRPVSKKRKPMSVDERAAQFGAFRALTGYEDVISETGRVTDSKIELDDYYIAEINSKLQNIIKNISNMPEITVTYFVPDSYKSGGAYITHTGRVKRIREIEKLIIFDDSTKVPINDILSIESRDDSLSPSGY